MCIYKNGYNIDIEQCINQQRVIFLCLETIIFVNVLRSSSIVDRKYIRV